MSDADFNDQLAELKSSLDQLIVLLREHGEQHWLLWAERCRHELDAYDAAAFDHILGEIDAATVVDAETRVGVTGIVGAMLNVVPGGISWFWPEFGGKVHQRQICAALVPAPAAAAGGWFQAGLQLVLAAASVQVRPGPTHGQVLEVLAEAFIAETLAVGGIAITRVCPDLLRPGIAVTARPAVIDQVAARFNDAAAADPVQVRRSRCLGERW